MSGRTVDSDTGLDIVGVAKRYGSTVGLAGLSLHVKRGVVTGVVGPNGAGKSTLMRIIAGEEHPDTGLLRLDGQRWNPNQDGGVGIVHQEPKLFADLTAGENLLVGRERRRLRAPRSGPAEQAALGRLGLGAAVDERVSDLSLAARQRVEIARAVAAESEVFIFDEPNSALTEEESTQLFMSIRELADRGKVVILVSHRLDEVVEVCDIVAVVKNGALKDQLDTRELSAGELAEELVDRSLVGLMERPRPHGGEALVKVRDWVGEKFSVSSLDLPDAKVSVLVGVEGSGARELAASLGGALPARGTVTVGDMTTAAYRMGRHALFVAGDRADTVVSDMSVAENLVLRVPSADVPEFFPGFPRRRALQTVAERIRADHRIQCESVNAKASWLSGGNQQKMVIASALAAGPRLLAIEEPTRGVDVGSRREIHEQLRAYADAGNTVIVFCAETLEAYELGDHVVVVDRGRPVARMTPGRYSDPGGLASAVADAIALNRRSQNGGSKGHRSPTGRHDQ